MILQSGNLYNQILCSNMKFSEYSSDMRKVVLINILLIISGTILLLFAIYNVFVHSDNALFIIDFTAFLITIYIFYDLRKSHNVQRASNITTSSIFIMMLAIVYFGKGHDFTLVWTVFFPMFAIFINGTTKGLGITILFYALTFLLTYQGIDKWQGGMWNEASYARFVVASVGISIIVYFFEVSFDKAYKMLEEIRKKEKQYIQTLEQCSITDPLTRVYNRRHLTVQFDKLFEKAKKHNSYFALYIFDIDYFKQYNDTFGHIAGDNALQKVTQTLTKEVFKRDVDHLFRLGGEEFCGLILADEPQKVEYILEKARTTIESLGLEHPKNPHKVLTASFGVCVIHDFKEKDFDKMYKIADDTLYDAKEKGRNCIVGADKISTL
ncbi:GGDEF domain-containing protein [Sulfurimonas marina]|uniref:diguanylate cyclase n=1 Tax=Sulfurimonas marina TaxID=2590551 RepID=A0A7M1AZ35_9BACT|nr:GGDEF domain-containing protein [Sulfurimonas marina]QOP41632.1 GGDEF domain-containing protein [Sulfurimonas marina]